MHKTVSILAIAGSIAFLGAGAAHAYPAPPAPVVGDIIDNDGVVLVGETVIFVGGGFAPGSVINITIINNGEPAAAGAGAGRVGAVRTGVIVLNQVVGGFTATADGNGNFSVPVELEEEGTYTLTATGLDPEGNERTVASVVTVSAPASAPVGGGTGTGGGTTGGGTAGGTTSGTTGGTASGTRGGLANTGIDSAMFLWGAAGIGALGLGAGSIVVARRRTDAEA